jgi:integron integrase
MTHNVRLLDRVRHAMRLRHYSYRTEQQYVGWIRRFILFHHKRHPQELGGPEVESFLSYLAVQRRVAAATQAQALAALLFLYKRVLNLDLPWLNSVVRASRPKRLPVVVRRVLSHLDGQFVLIAGLLYGSGLRVLEALRLRVKDLDLERRLVLVRDGTGAKDHVTILPDSLSDPLRRQIESVRERHQYARSHGFGGVDLPRALAHKYPGAHLQIGWQWLFPNSWATRA